VKFVLPFFRRRVDRETEEVRRIDRLARGATCIPVGDAMVCANDPDHFFNGRFSQTCPCGNQFAFSVEPTSIRTRLAEVRKGRS
jgi:hypothetical protein